MKPEADVYEELTVHLSRLGMGMPAREELTDIIRRMFSPEEAEVALRLPTEVAPLEVASPEEVAERLGRSADEVTAVLEGMASRGVLYSGRTREGGRGYGLLQTGFGFPQTFFWDGGRSPEAAEMAGLVARYFNRHVTREAYGGSATKAYRYVPVEASLEADLQAVLPGHLMDPILEGAELFALANCPCRVAVGLRGGDCSHPRDVCLKFDEMAEYVVDRGLGREVSREEARAVVERSREAGLVHFVDNAEGRVKHNCNCCGCACWNVGNIRRRKIPRDAFMATYFLRATDEEECSGCGDCADICPVDAVKMDDQGVARIDEDWCIGCGVCVPRCSTGAASLSPRPDRSLALPPDFATLHDRIIADKKAGVGMDSGPAEGSSYGSVSGSGGRFARGAR